MNKQTPYALCAESQWRKELWALYADWQMNWEVFQEQYCVLKKTVSRSLGEGKERFKKKKSLIQMRWSYQNTNRLSGQSGWNSEQQR